MNLPRNFNYTVRGGDEVWSAEVSEGSITILDCDGNCGGSFEVSYAEGRVASGSWVLVEEDKEPTNQETQWTASHYDNNYTLTKEDIKNGYVRLDSYKVNRVWGINSVDPTGAAFHCLKTLNRLGNQKNTLEREINALHGQVKAWAKEMGITLK